MSLSGEAEALASRLGSSHSGNLGSSVLSNAGAKADDLEKKLGAEDPEGQEVKSEEPKVEQHPSSLNPHELPESKGTSGEPEEKEAVHPSTDAKTDENTKGEDASEAGKEDEDNHGDEKPGDGAKDNEEKHADDNDKDKNSQEPGDNDDKDESPKGDDAKSDAADAKDKPDPQASDKSDQKGQDKDSSGKNTEAPPVPTVPDAPDLTHQGVDGFEASPPDEASTLTPTDRPWEPADGYTATSGLDAFSQSHEASELGEAEWLEILENCGAMYGWCINGPMKQIVRAPKPAFQLKPVQPPAKPLNAPPTSPAGTSNASSKGTPVSSTSSSSPGTLTPATSTACSTPPSLKASPQTKPPAAAPVSTSRAAAVNGEGYSIKVTAGAKDTQVSIVSGSQISESKTSKSHTAKPSPKSKPKRILPDFAINDNSRIDVVVSSHEFQTSMATNDFSASSTSASLGGSYGPISASVSYSEQSMHSSSTSNTSDTYNKTMIAKYLFPRVDLHLGECLEPTEGLKKALEKVEATKNIKDLRQLRQDYGYLFCTSITIGGRLQTQSIMTDTEKTSAQQQKQSMKTSVGLAVASPEASASVSHTQESGSANSQSQATSDKSESHAFEAMGDTLLASNPLAWIPTVGNYKNWRIINRDGLILMSDMISGLSGFERTRSWFEQAVPSLSKYIEFSDKIVKKIRLRLMSPNHHLCLSNKTGSDDPDFATPPNYYFGHRPMSKVMPISMELKQADVHWGDIEMPSGSPEFLFSPGSYRAPAIYGYAANKVGDNFYGTKYDNEYKSTVWSITSPYDDVLCHESRVIIQTVSPGNSAPAITGDSGSNAIKVSTSASMVSSLIVFRNQQGVFLPAMSDTKDVHIWRVLKNGVAPGEKANIAEGDQIQLAWSYQDQYCGYRDFTQDAFGRRRNGPPPEAKSSTLYMRLPWPRFEPVTSLPDQVKPLPNALMMSEVAQAWDDPKASLPDTIAAIKNQEQTSKQILVEDCIFRLDVVKHHGRGDVEDYLLRGVRQDAKFPDVVKREKLEKQIEEQLEDERKEREQQREAMFQAIFEDQGDSESAGKAIINTVFPISNLFW
ncbi:hypothetical protein FHETE_7707 [Fusarium heterosporum]|uniref:MACPF domain-containing protein n=1 Tax=Fusarium heterosporum TaxID=42747 RepID=A0A8H5T687_FUSHE|nr:hypothetical protein FHETE_7707 [Fusarium heterosporum]